MVKRFTISVVFVVWAFMAVAQDKKEEKKPDPPIETIDQLKDAIEKILKYTGTNAAGIAMVDSKGPVWIAGLGKADVEKNIDADSTTMFRIGSVTKMFVSLSILKLQEEGRIKLDDKVRDLAPEIAFQNKWEDTNPIRIAHLLEHTTGWDDIHLSEYAFQVPDSLGVKYGLDFHPHSRTSRWVPGTRMSYCNAGPPVAAYIVEKITGQPFEKYVEENFFKPMGMESMTYFESETYKQKGATLYEGNRPRGYWHIIMRPSGSINASPRDMAKMVQFFVDSASVDGVHLISKASLQRMETPSTTSGARAGMRAGYGLSNYTSIYKSFVYHGHNGGVNGGVTDLSYLPGYGVGYVVMINSGEGNTLNKITDLIREFQTKDLHPVKPDSGMSLNEKQKTLTGYYTIINPRNQSFAFIDRAFNVERLFIQNGVLTRRPMVGGTRTKYVPMNDYIFKLETSDLTSLVSTHDPLAGPVVHANTRVLKPLNAFSAMSPLIITCAWLVFAFSSLIFAVVWLINLLRGKLQKGPALQIRLWPFLASAFFLLNFIFWLMGNSDPLTSLGAPSIVSVGIVVLSICFALATTWSLVVVIKSWNKKLGWVLYTYSFILTILHAMVMIYLMMFGMIGSPSWT